MKNPSVLSTKVIPAVKGKTSNVHKGMFVNTPAVPALIANNAVSDAVSKPKPNKNPYG
ncbi:hypothetical protein HS5_15060 [Acidianus sp. HS-5]|nr:hypothetical protein HS5_15060 [Acidianus sp. HS-5]